MHIQVAYDWCLPLLGNHSTFQNSERYEFNDSHMLLGVCFGYISFLSGILSRIRRIHSVNWNSTNHQSIHFYVNVLTNFLAVHSPLMLVWWNGFSITERSIIDNAASRTTITSSCLAPDALLLCITKLKSNFTALHHT